MRCLVLGGTGFLGSHLCEALIDINCDVIVYSRKVIGYENLNLVKNKISIVNGDFTTDEQLEKVTENIDVVFHLISSTTPNISNKDMIFDVKTNILPTIRLLEACRKNSVKKIIFFSSGGTVYGIPEILPITESHKTNPICSYGIHKLTIEKYIQLYGHLYNIDFSIMRISNPYSYRQSSFTGQGVIATFLKKALNDNPIEIWGDGNVIRDFIYATDVARATLELINYKGEYKVFNVGSGCGCSLNEIVYTIENILSKKLKVIYTKARKEDVPVNILDISRISNETSWKPQIPLHDGIRMILNNWCK